MGFARVRIVLDALVVESVEKKLKRWSYFKAKTYLISICHRSSNFLTKPR